jgi:shikimate dehydrogenase
MMKLGLIGEVLGHSLSPDIHREILNYTGTSGTYELIEIPKDQLTSRIPELIRTMDGFNVTIPYKVDVIPFLSRIDEPAQRIGAINTVVIRDDRTAGYNTDYEGFRDTLRLFDMPVKGKKTAVMGTGGASRAVIRCLADEGASDIRVVSRHPEKAAPDYQAFLSACGASLITYDQLENEGEGALLVNATPCGMFPHTEGMPVSAETISRFTSAVDLIYNPKETRFLKTAREAGCRAASGLYMLVIQAMASEEYWLDRELPIEMAQDIVEKVEKKL